MIDREQAIEAVESCNPGYGPLDGWHSDRIADAILALPDLVHEKARELLRRWDSEPRWATNTVGVCASVEDLRAALANELSEGTAVVCPSGDRGVITGFYTTNVGQRRHANVALDDGRVLPCLVSNLRRPEPEAVRSSPVDQRGVHLTHCCPRHGCKYSSDDCPVEHGGEPPTYPHNNGCEQCAAEHVPVTDEMVERAAIALNETTYRPGLWTGLTEDERDKLRGDARAALDAALNGDKR